MTTRVWHLLPRGVAAGPAPQLIWCQGPQGRTELHTAADRCQGEEGQWPHPGRECSQGEPWGLRSSSQPWGPGAWSFALLKYQPIRGTAAGLPAEPPRLAQGTAHTAMWHRWHSTALLGAEPILKASRGFAPHCMRPTRRHPTAVVCPHPPGYTRHGVLQVLTRMSVPSLRPGPGSSPVPRSAAVLAGRRMGRLAERASRAACSTFSSSPGLATRAQSCQSPLPRGAWVGLTFVPLHTFHPQVVSPKAIRLKLEGEWCVRLVQVDVHLAVLNRPPLKDRQQDVPVGYHPYGSCGVSVPIRAVPGTGTLTPGTSSSWPARSPPRCQHSGRI